LNASNISWRYYSPNANSLWTAPNAIQHTCDPNAEPPNATSCLGSDWVNNVVLYTAANPAPILTDISNSQLPSVSWVMPTMANSDRAGSPATTGGPSWVAAIVNAIGNSSYWGSTAIFITWDDWGGWYDHVPLHR
jgi:phospholipase C